MVWALAWSWFHTYNVKAYTIRPDCSMCYVSGCIHTNAGWVRTLLTPIYNGAKIINKYQVASDVILCSLVWDFCRDKEVLVFPVTGSCFMRACVCQPDSSIDGCISACTSPLDPAKRAKMSPVLTSLSLLRSRIISSLWLCFLVKQTG